MMDTQVRCIFIYLLTIIYLMPNKENKIKICK